MNLVQFNEEFDAAFIVDPDCMDDESEIGLGRAGVVFCPSEFADMYGVKTNWRKV